ncbi:DUF58 domain-containing protein [Homoserinibacter sp. GY 40078]|uniref:DUF58 domain-containing protein n=1 Tax=Homoserinibacter sp. GY 40078 TaxID=2603275 RepID=UPI0011C767FF|nr:DUF58 domain-containing protein [Homoserinibacter sp. GY 40078]TXK16986.1 DUF58 domain-containing protein [Homoserinibacter sp. GY 40078]
MSAPSLLRRRRRLRLTARGWVAIVVGLVCLVLGYTTGRGELLVAGSLALLLSLGGLLVARIRRPDLGVVRLFSPPVVAAGSTTHVTLRVHNASSLATPVLRTDDTVPWREALPAHTIDTIRSGTVAQRTVEIGFELHPPRRGLFPVGPLVVEHADPFGMARALTAVGDVDRLTVVPAVTPLPEGGPVLIDGDGTAQLVQRRAVGNDDDLSTREYRHGDALRRVHWRASARHGELMVRQEEHRSHPDARIVVDTRLGGYPDAEADDITWPRTAHSEAFEWAVRMLASLAVHLDEQGFRVGIVETGAPQVVDIGERWEGGQRVEAFLTSLASVRLLDRRQEGELPSAGPDASGPTFAILADADEDVVEWVLRQRRPGQAGAVFLLGMRASARERFADAGWVCVDAAASDDPGDAWRSSATEAGFIRGAH